MVAAVLNQFAVAPQCQLKDEQVAVFRAVVHPEGALPVGEVPAVAILVEVLPVEVILVVDPWEGHPVEEVVCREGANQEGELQVVGGVVAVAAAAQHRVQSGWLAVAVVVAGLPWVLLRPRLRQVAGEVVVVVAAVVVGEPRR